MQGLAAGLGTLVDRADVALTASLNGDRITRDGQTPLAAGDTVSFLSAARVR